MGGILFRWCTSEQQWSSAASPMGPGVVVSQRKVVPPGWWGVSDPCHRDFRPDHSAEPHGFPAVTNSASTMKPRSPLWCRMKEISSAVSMKLTGTRTTAARASRMPARRPTSNYEIAARSARPAKPVSRSCRSAVDQIVEFGEGQYRVAVEERGVVGVAAGGSAGDVAEHPGCEFALSGPRDHQASSACFVSSRRSRPMISRMISEVPP